MEHVFYGYHLGNLERETQESRGGSNVDKVFAALLVFIHPTFKGIAMRTIIRIGGRWVSHMFLNLGTSLDGIPGHQVTLSSVFSDQSQDFHLEGASDGCQ